MKKRQVWVSDSFKKMLRRQAIEEDVNVLELTRRLAERNQFPECYKVEDNKKRKKRGFNFEL